ncbi:MAG: glycosyltransferase family 1 protein, partial [Candidatus Aminicenantes bacterium]|nr:glycosyltransferase family 1 protein [Candidatus Aminicenantes bacterium]
MQKKIGIVVQRYGSEINGGAEYHAKLITEKMAKYYAIEVFTTTALDYITWDPHFPPGQDQVDGIRVNRFNVHQTRDPERFGKIQDFIFNSEHSLEEEITWLDEEGPRVPALIKELENREGDLISKHILA